MFVAFLILLFMYVGLTLLYIATNVKETKITPWPILTKTIKPIKSSCQSNTDCLSSHICLGNECIPKLSKLDKCNSDTGQWISYIYQGVVFAICVCLKPHLFNQKYFGGNCDVNVGCGVHGFYLPDENKCVCDSGYTPVGLTCQKLPAYLNLNFCNPYFDIEVSKIPDGMFHKDYLKRLSSVKCVKRPCSFDAFTEKPLKRTKFVEGWGCVCDPRYGNFGVLLEGNNKKYLNTPGFDACANIFYKEPEDAIDVKLITYFYLAKREPVSFILFEHINPDNRLSHIFHKQTKLIIRQKLWQYDYAQYFFDNNPKFRARTRYLSSVFIFNIETANEWYYLDNFSPAKCDEISKFWLDRLNPRSDVYDLLYKSPVCRVNSNDSKADPMFRNKIIVNPHHITFKDYTNLHRFNAFVLDYDSSIGNERWTLDLDYEYKINTYLSIDTNAPNYEVIRKDKPSIPQLMIEGQS